MSNPDSEQHRKFKERIARLSGQPETQAPAGALAVAASGAHGPATHHAPKPERAPMPPGFKKSMAFAGGLAAASLLLANVMYFGVRMQPPGPGDFFGKLILAGGPWALTTGFLLVLMIGLGLRDKPHVIGIALALPAFWFGEPYLAYLAPDAWAGLYSVEHVDNMLIQAGLRTPPMAF